MHMYTTSIRKMNNDKSVVIHGKATLHLWVIVNKQKNEENIVENYQTSKIFVFPYSSGA